MCVEDWSYISIQRYGLGSYYLLVYLRNGLSSLAAHASAKEERTERCPKALQLRQD